MADLLAGAAIVAAGLYLIALGISCFVRPSTVARFLLGFARSALLHYLELVLRVLVGTSLVQRAPDLPYPMVFNVFGWILTITSLVMFAVPWRWHRQFAERVVPQALRYIKLLGVSSIALGAALAASVFMATAA